MQTLVLDYIPTSLNEYIDAERGNKFAGASIKKKETEAIAWECKKQKLTPVKGKVKLSCNWYYKSRKDLDNVVYAKKYILDGLVTAGILPNDNKKTVVGFKDTYIDDTVDQVIIDIISLR